MNESCYPYHSVVKEELLCEGLLEEEEAKEVAKANRNRKTNKKET